MPYKDPKSPAAIAPRKRAEEAYRLAHPEKYKQIHKKWEASPRAKETRSRYARGAGRSVVLRRSYLKTFYGMTLEQYDAILAEQSGVCAICTQKCSTGRRLAVDHDHIAKIIRGLLCANCN